MSAECGEEDVLHAVHLQPGRTQWWKRLSQRTAEGKNRHTWWEEPLFYWNSTKIVDKTSMLADGICWKNVCIGRNSDFHSFPLVMAIPVLRIFLEFLCKYDSFYYKWCVKWVTVVHSRWLFGIIIWKQLKWLNLNEKKRGKFEKVPSLHENSCRTLYNKTTWLLFYDHPVKVQSQNSEIQHVWVCFWCNCNRKMSGVSFY